MRVFIFALQGSDQLWPYLLGLLFIPCLIHIVGLPWCIQSPKHLFIIQDNQFAAKKCIFLYLFSKKFSIYSYLKIRIIIYNQSITFSFFNHSLSEYLIKNLIN
jgi:hypothetical protein